MQMRTKNIDYSNISMESLKDVAQKSDMNIDELLGLWWISTVERYTQQAVAYRISKYKFGLELQLKCYIGNVGLPRVPKNIGNYFFKNTCLTDCDNPLKIGKCTKYGSIIWFDKEINQPIEIWKRHGITAIKCKETHNMVIESRGDFKCDRCSIHYLNEKRWTCNEIHSRFYPWREPKEIIIHCNEDVCFQCVPFECKSGGGSLSFDFAKEISNEGIESFDAQESIAIRNSIFKEMPSDEPND